MFAPLVIVALAIPVCVVASLVLVAWLMTPAMVSLVEARRFPTLERRDGAGFLQSLAWSLGCTLVALVALVVEPAALAHSAAGAGGAAADLGLAHLPRVLLRRAGRHASREERRRLMEAHRWPLFGMGVLTGYLGAAPSLLWA